MLFRTLYIYTIHNFATSVAKLHCTARYNCTCGLPQTALRQSRNFTAPSAQLWALGSGQNRVIFSEIRTVGVLRTVGEGFGKVPEFYWGNIRFFVKGIRLNRTVKPFLRFTFSPFGDGKRSIMDAPSIVWQLCLLCVL